MAAGVGFEPTTSGSKPLVLPFTLTRNIKIIHILDGDASGICLLFLVTGPVNTTRFQSHGLARDKRFELLLLGLEPSVLPLH